MPNPPFLARLDRLQADIAYFEREIAEGRCTAGMRGRLRQLQRKLTWYHARTTERIPGGPRAYRFPQGRPRRYVSPTPPDLVLDVQALLNA